MNIENIMTKDIIVGDVDDNICKISILMKKYDIGFVPIAIKNKIIGVITDRDIIVKAVCNNDFDNKIDNYITRNVIYIDVYKSLEDAINLMGKEKVKRLIVTNKKKVVGILSLSDIINTNINEDLIIKNLKKIWEIYRSIDEYRTEIDEFYL